jgi:serpin B
MTRRDSLKLLGLLGLGTALPVRFGRSSEPIEKPVKPSAKEHAMAAATAAFGCDLFAKLRSKAGNLFFSPLSIETALAMTSAGARGETLAEMSKVLHLPDAGAQAAVGDLLRGLQAAPGAKYELAIANALWGQQELPFRQEFLAATQKDYGATLHPVDFRQTEQARQTINHWVEEKTKDKIKDLFAPGTLTADNRLVLTNAIYFKGKWAAPFMKGLTRDEPFHLVGGGTVQAPLMRHDDRYRYFAADGEQAVDLPYAGGRMAMLVILPAAADGLPALEKRLSSERLATLVEKLRYQHGQVLLPRFKMTEEFDLSATLQDMGMKRAFSVDADFGGMCAEPLMISKVIHKAFVETNEEGSEAAAATGVTMRVATAMAPEAPFTFRADRPFLFAIRDTTTGTPLFVGRVANPTNQG